MSMPKLGCFGKSSKGCGKSGKSGGGSGKGGECFVLFVCCVCDGGVCEDRGVETVRLWLL